ncbi:MAG: malate dehydrogenase [Candidatus Saganbacteria bacterium]|nr:malate dehydrogenase [Candidatus Saganbacteria bacterium]
MKPKVTVVGSGNVGAECARRLLQSNLCNVVLIDIVEGLPQGKALDMLQSCAIEGYAGTIIGTNNYEDTKDSQIVVITAGLARKPGMSRDDLLHKNETIVKGIVEQIAKYSPNAILLLVTNPLDVMTYLSYKASKFPTNRVLGMAPLLDQSRMEAFIAMELNVPITDVSAMVIATHGDAMVPLPRLSTVKGKPVTELLSKEKIDAIVARTANGGAEIVNLLKTGSAYYAPAASAAHMAIAMLKDSKERISSCVYLDGQYGEKDIYLGTLAKLGKNGVEEIVEIKLTPEEETAFHAAAAKVRADNQKLGYTK